MAFLPPLLAAAGSTAGTAAGGVAKGATAAAGALGSAGKAVGGGFSSLLQQGDPSAATPVSQGVPATQGAVMPIAGTPSPDVMGETPGLQPMQDSGGDLMSKLSGFLDSPLGQTLREGASQGRGMDLFGNTDMGAGAQLSPMQPSQQRDVLAFLQQYMSQRR